MIRRLSRIITLAAVGSLAAAPADAQFWETRGVNIVDPDGRRSMLRGIGLGGWLMPEGYMLHMGGSWTSMKQRVQDLVGAQEAAAIWDRYRELYVTEKDVEAMASWGVDHLRLPFHYEVFYDLSAGRFNEDGFALLDEFLGWCETYGIPVILDMHAAPGAQSAGDIADSDGQARLWTQPGVYQPIAIHIWEEIARRYRDDTRIIGYDLLNEPVTPESIPDGAAALRDFYDRLVAAVRAIDPNHILFIEGNYWATTFDRLTPPFDSNMVYAFHKYWNATDQGTINYLLAIRTNHGTPLWLGETGENSNVWLHEVMSLHEDLGIPWNFWTHKKLGTTTAPLSAPIPAGFQRLLDYWNGQAARPTAQQAREGLWAMVENLHIDSTDVRPDVIDSLFDPTFGSARRPYADNWVPGLIPVVHYDSGLQGVTYRDTEYWAISGSPGGGNNGGQYRNDGVDIERSSGAAAAAYNVGWIEPGEWLEYTLDVETTGTYRVSVGVASPSGGGGLGITIDGVDLGQMAVSRTGGWQVWAEQEFGEVQLTEGLHLMRLRAGSTTGYNLSAVRFELVSSDGTDQRALRVRGLWPVPAASSARLELSLAEAGTVTVEVADVLGRVVRSHEAAMDAGRDRLTLDLSGLPAGVYYCRVGYQGPDGTVRETVKLPVVR